MQGSFEELRETLSASSQQHQNEIARLQEKVLAQEQSLRVVKESKSALELQLEENARLLSQHHVKLQCSKMLSEEKQQEVTSINIHSKVISNINDF